MEKPKQIRELLQQSVPQLGQNPERLILTIGEGQIVATGATSLSFEWQYQLEIGVVDFAGHPDMLLIPLLAWLRQHSLNCSPTRTDGKTPSSCRLKYLPVTSMTC